MSDKTNYEIAKAGLVAMGGDKMVSPEKAALAAQLAVADAINTLTATLKSFAVGESQGGRTLEVRVRQ